MAVERVVVDHHLGVDRLPGVVSGDDEWVDLSQRAIGLDECLIKLLSDARETGNHLRIDPEGETEATRLVAMQTEHRVGDFSMDLLGRVRGDLFDVDATLAAGHDRHAARGAIDDDAEVELALNANGWSDEHLVDYMPTNIEPKDLLTGFTGFGSRFGDLDAARFAASAAMHLSLDDDRAAELVGGRFDLAWGKYRQCPD